MALTLVTLADDDMELVVCGSCDTAAIHDEATELGFVHDEDREEWQCERCATAPATPRLVGMRAS